MAVSSSSPQDEAEDERNTSWSFIDEQVAWINSDQPLAPDGHSESQHAAPRSRNERRRNHQRSANKIHLPRELKYADESPGVVAEDPRLTKHADLSREKRIK